MPGMTSCRVCGERIDGHPPQPGDVEPGFDERGFFCHPDCLKKEEEVQHRHEGQPGYLGPAAEAQRDREAIAARLASPNRSKVSQDDPATLALFAPIYEPRLI